MNKNKHFIIYFVFMLFITGCGESQVNENSEKQLIKQFEITNLQNEVTERDFKLSIFTERTHYSASDEINVYAELTYIGEESEVSIGHAMYPVGFSLFEHTRKIQFYGAMATPYVVTTLKPNEPAIYKFTGIGEYSEHDSKKLVEFAKKLMKGDFPEGQYTITAHAYFNIDGDPDTANYTMDTDISFIIE